MRGWLGPAPAPRGVLPPRATAVDFGTSLQNVIKTQEYTTQTFPSLPSTGLGTGADDLYL